MKHLPVQEALPSGEVVDVVNSRCLCPPDHDNARHMCVHGEGGAWCRVDGGPWMRMDMCGYAALQAAELLQAADTVNEWLRAIGREVPNGKVV